MPENIISAERDDSGNGAVNIHARETARPGSPRNTELWHIPHSMEPNKPLCGASLSGRFKRTKGHANCSPCRDRMSLSRIDDRYFGVLAAMSKGLPIPAYPSRWMDHDSLYEADLITDVGGRVVLTPRGKIVADDVIDPPGWLDQASKLYHARRPVRLEALCGATFGAYYDPVSTLETLQSLERSRKGRLSVTCVRCAIHIERKPEPEW